jgi:predicted tellurium resistance membrane protein TerC
MNPLEWISDPTVWASLLTLTAMEIVLGIDNIVFISVVVSRLPPDQADTARKIGLALALVFRVILLLLLTWIIGLTQPVFDLGIQGGLDPVTGYPTFETQFTWKDIILLAGGLFLLVKATREIHLGVEGGDEEDTVATAGRKAAFGATIGQIVLIDIIFSVDSIITAVGMVDPA